MNFCLEKDLIIKTNDKFHQHKGITNEILDEIIQSNKEEIIRQYRLGETTISITNDFGHQVGVTTCISCERGNKNVYFAKRGKRPYLSRMVKGKPQPTSKATIILRKDAAGLLLITAWFGEKAAPELGDVKYFENCKDAVDEIAKSSQFWLSHALIDENTID